MYHYKIVQVDEESKVFTDSKNLVMYQRPFHGFSTSAKAIEAGNAVRGHMKDKTKYKVVFYPAKQELIPN